MKSTPDTEYLRLISVFHYVVAGVLTVCSMFPLLHLAMGVAIVAGAFDETDRGNAPPDFFGWLLIIFAGMMIVCGLAIAIAVAIAGRRIRAHTSYMYCLVVAGIECIFMPFGTALGVFTIIVLMKPTVRELFGVDHTAES